MRLPWLILLCVVGAEAAAEPAPGDIVSQCLSCHMVGPDQIDIIGLSALEALPVEWPFLFEDAFDLDGDGIAGRMRFVSGSERPLVGLFGSALSAGRFEDFAAIAAGAHGLVINGPGEMAQIRAAFEALSPDPGLPFCSAAAQAAFEARGCADCHVTRSFEHNGRHYMPLSDFLLHDLGDGPRRTTPLWGCPECLTGPGHGVTAAEE